MLFDSYYADSSEEIRYQDVIRELLEEEIATYCQQCEQDAIDNPWILDELDYDYYASFDDTALHHLIEEDDIEG